MHWLLRFWLRFLHFVCAVSLLIMAGESSRGNPAWAGEWEAPAWADTLASPVVFDSAAQVEARALYLKNCSVCHGETGRGDGMMARGMQPPPENFAESGELAEESDGALFWKISNGKKPMPSWSKDLSEAQRWALVSYVKGLAPVVIPPITAPDSLRETQPDTIEP
jgi:mono/diheme cytochrome c family protein